ncbi:fibronectin type III domain-containing protein [Amycolatopsis sp. OK19-0408]|uniref:Fibronectin type III domain-containing protein n=1 Tax=Amycolatopsis iheyensis TaxID=2945988 RepID=A0A9X2NIZ7_9PSEU|nr:fibronectin type III domain-containing protein [Amycolatopsis iheyensis]MCR6489631.1 fibronectin type III domain-containing protein [Amycolatopsis iheyensis]
MPERGFKRRLPLTVLAATCLGLVVAVATGAVKPVPGLELTQAGHWVANPGLGLVFFVNGANRSVDAQAAVPGLEPGSDVVQGDTSAYVIGRQRIIELGKSDLTVDRTLDQPVTSERPVSLETAGGPYLVYREAGRVVRLGDAFTSIDSGGSLGDPVATSDGTVWLQRTGDGMLCKLPKGGETLGCSVQAARGHTGALTVVGDTPVFVDTTEDTLQTVADTGLGKPLAINASLSPAAQIAPADADGRIAVLEPDARKLYFVDASGLSAGRAAGRPQAVDLGDGNYARPTASASSVVLLDLTSNTVLTYAPDGTKRHTMPVPPENGSPKLSRGEDKRVYIEGAQGDHVLVVDQEGTVAPVAVTADKKPVSQVQAPPPSTSQLPPQRGTSGGDRPKPPPAAPPPTSQKALPASPPGVPGGLRATLAGTTANVTWGAATPNGAVVTGYRVSWTPSSGSDAGSAVLGGGVRSTSVPSLREGVTYTITVAAENSAGRGAPATARVTRPAAPKPAITISRGTTGTYDSSCEAPACAKIRVVMKGFKPGTRVLVRPWSSDPDYDNEGRTIDIPASGGYTFEAFDFAQVGNQVWVLTDTGVKSNVITWKSG